MKKLLQGFWRSFSTFLKKKLSPDQKAIAKDQAGRRVPTPSVIKRAPEKLYIQVGLDFGTSCSKACYQIDDGSQKVYLIDFGHQLSLFPSYAVPSFICSNSKDDLLIGEEAGKLMNDRTWRGGLSNFKTLLAGTKDESFIDEVSRASFNENLHALNLKDKGVGAFEVASLYIAYMMRLCRDKLSARYKGQELHINYNVCVPIDYVENNPVKKDFETMLAVAQELERSWSLDGNFKDMLFRAIELKGTRVYDKNTAKIFLIPEAIAELAAYRMSVGRDTGLHALVDIGSGTTDVSIFRLDRGQKERAVWLAAEAIPFGTYQLEKIIVEILEKHRQKDSFGEVYKTFEGIDENARGIKKVVFSAVRERMRSFVENEYRQPWKDAHKILVKQRKEKLDDIKIIFFSGGGLRVALAPGIEFLFQRVLKEEKFFRLLQLSNNSNLDGKLASDFWRLSVAYGLSFPEPKLGEYKLPKDFPGEPPLLPEVRDSGDRDDTR